MANELTSFNGADGFGENTTHYGISPSLYIRAEPTTALTVAVGPGPTNSYICGHDPGLLIDGAGDYFPAFMAPDATPAIAGVAGCVLHRLTWRSAYDVALTPQLHLVGGGTPTDYDYYFIGVWARVRLGTYVAASGGVDDYWQNVDGYCLAACTRVNVGRKWAVFKVVGGTMYVLDSRDMVTVYSGADAALYGAHGPSRLRLKTTTSAGNVNIVGYVDIHTSGVPVETLIFNIVDDGTIGGAANANPGRCGFSIPFQRGGTPNPQVVARKFVAYDTALPTTPFVNDDLFTRRDTLAMRSFTDPVSGQTGRCLMSHWAGDEYGNRTTTSPTGSGFYAQLRRHTAVADEAKVGDNLDTSSVTQSWGWHISQRESFVAPSARTSLVFTMVNYSGEQNAIGIAHRATVTGGHYRSGVGQAHDTYKRGYVALLVYDGSGNHSIEVRHYPTGGAYTLLATASVTATYGNECTLDFEIQNIDNGASTLRPGMRVKFGQGSTADVVLTPNGSVAGVIFDTTNNILLDDRSASTMIGSGMGFVIERTDATTQKTNPIARFNTWNVLSLSTDFNIGGGGLGEDEDDSAYESVFFRSEIDGATGTLTVPTHWPVRVDDLFQINTTNTRNAMTTVFPRSTKGRRRWTVTVPADDPEQAQTIQDFMRTHGAAIPFSWTEPVLGQSVYGRFTRDAVRTAVLMPTVGAYEFEIDECHSPYDFDLPEASFDLHAGALATVWTQAHVADTDGSYVITVTLSEGAPLDDTKVGYTIQSVPGFQQPVEGTHYTISAGSSPLIFAEGETTKTITVTILNPNKWFEERAMRFVFDLTTSSFVTFAGDRRGEFRLFIYSTESFPIVNFVAASSTATSTFHSVSMTRSGSSTLEPTPMWFRNTTPDAGFGGLEAQYDVDFRIANGSAPGERFIGSGVPNGTVVIERLPTYTAGRKIQLTIDYEANDDSDKNLALYTATTRACQETKNQPTPWPGISELLPQVPTMKAHGPDAALNGSLMPWTPFSDTTKTTTQGDLAPGLIAVYSGATANNAYYRDSFDDEFFCDGPSIIPGVNNYNQMSVYWATATGKPAPRFVQLTLRDRIQNAGAHVVFDRQSNGQDYQGNSISTVTTDEGVWGVYRQVNELQGTITAVGIVEETITSYDGTTTNHTRLWFVYNASAGEVSTPMLSVKLFWPVADGSNYVNASDRKTWAQLDGYAALLYDWSYVQSASSMGAPDRHWPRRRGQYEPRGQARAGVTQTTHVITL